MRNPLGMAGEGQPLLLDVEEENQLLLPNRVPVTHNICKIVKEGWPFLGNRAIEVGVDFGAMIILSQLDSDRGDAASLITSMCIVLRSINATFLYYTGQDVRENKATPLIVGKVLRNSWLFGLPLSIIAMGVAFASEPLLKGLGEPETPVHITRNFLWTYAPGLLPTLWVISNQQTLLGLNKPKVVLAMTALHTPLVLPLGYLFTFTLGLKETGLGLAYSLVASLHFLSYLVLFKLKFRDLHVFNLRDLLVRDGKCIFLARKGFWIGLYAFLELGNVWSNTILIGRTSDGGDALSSVQPALQYASVLANLTFALGHSVGILVKGSSAELKHTEARRLGNTGISLGFVLPVLTLVVFSINRDILLKPFLSNDIDALARNLLLINLVGQLADSLRNSASGALRGLGNTSFATNVNAATVVFIMAPLSLIAQMVLNWGPEAILLVRTAGIAVGGGLIAYKWLTASRSLPADGVAPLPAANASGEERGCLSRVRAALFGSRNNVLQIQQQPAQAQATRCVIL